MKRFNRLFITFIQILFVFNIQAAQAARPMAATGKVVDPNGSPIAYATVVLLDAGRQVAGTATDDDGTFTLKAPAGTYRLTIQYLGYQAIETEVTIPADPGQYTLQPATVAMQEVVVETRSIRREADRFIMEVANSPVAAGKDGTELLKQAPGVWLTEDKIAINGASGVKIYINDREMRMSVEELLNYLRGLRAEEIQRIEIIPQAGADYDADSASGIIRITLRRQRDNGLTGNVSFSTQHSRQMSNYNPSVSLNGHTGRWTFNVSGWLNAAPRQTTKVAEHTEYLASDALLDAISEMRGDGCYGGGRAGVIFDIAERHSIGVEGDYYADRTRLPNNTSTDFRSGGTLTQNESFYDGVDKASTLSATFNYIWRIDTLGSTLKVMADYSRNDRRHTNDNFTRSTTPPDIVRDSTFDDRTAGLYEVAAFNIALEQRLGEMWQLRAGTKYTFNNMHNEALYRCLKDGSWQQLDKYSYATDYTERIAALYAAATFRGKRWGVVAGVRGEYTRTTGYASDIRQHYLSLFPNANVSYTFDDKGAWSLSAQYSRNISRPGFWALNPARIQISDYTYQSGNPALQPSYTDNLSVTALLATKYTLSIGAQFHHDEIAQVFGSDPADASITNLCFENLDHSEQFYASANLPIRLTRWWSLTANITEVCRRDRITADSPHKTTWMTFGNLTTNVTLPRKFIIEVEVGAMSRVRQANLDMKSYESTTLRLKKRLLDDRLSFTVQVSNLFDQAQEFTAETGNFIRNLRTTNDWARRRFGISVNYNFKTGKAFRIRSVESGAGDEKGRM